MVRLLLAALFLLVGCIRPEGDDEGIQLPGSRARSGSGSVSLTGAGATFPYPLYTKWISEYGKGRPRVQINYQSIGSGGGIRQVTQRTVDFGASDAAMNDEQISRAPGILHVPTAIGAVTIAYNLPGVSERLQLSSGTVAGIFLGEVKRWNDPRILADNPGLALPDAPLLPMHRSDGSGTTKIFVEYLSTVSEAWRVGPGSGTSVSFPVGLGAKGNEGVSAMLTSTPYSVGYVELAYASQTGLAYAAIKNRAGRYALPSIESTTAAASGRVLPDDLRMSIVDAEGDDSYPIAGFTYVLLFREQTDARKGQALVDFLRWAVTDGQSLSAPLHYAPLPDVVVTAALAKLSSVTAAGVPLL